MVPLQRQVLPNAEHLPHADLEYRQGDEHFHLVTERRYLKSDTLHNTAGRTSLN